MFSRLAVKTIIPRVRQTRQFSAHGGESAKAEAQKWMKLTAGMVGLSTAAFLYNMATLEHDHGRQDLPYMHIRSKPFPWSCPDCELFNQTCWDECKGRGSAAASSHH